MKYAIRGLLVGILVGQLIMVPHVIKWMKWPVIYTLPVPYDVYTEIGDREYKIKDVTTKYEKKKHDMLIRIKSVRDVQEDCLPFYEDDCETVMGFYYFDEETKQHVVTSCDSSDVLQHEIRHAFEGPYHRNLDEDYFCPLRKKESKK